MTKTIGITISTNFISPRIFENAQIYHLLQGYFILTEAC